MIVEKDGFYIEYTGDNPKIYPHFAIWSKMENPLNLTEFFWVDNQSDRYRAFIHLLANGADELLEYVW